MSGSGKHTGSGLVPGDVQRGVMDCMGQPGLENACEFPEIVFD